MKGRRKRIMDENADGPAFHVFGLRKEAVRGLQIGRIPTPLYAAFENDNTAKGLILSTDQPFLYAQSRILWNGEKRVKTSVDFITLMR